MRHHPDHIQDEATGVGREMSELYVCGNGTFDDHGISVGAYAATYPRLRRGFVPKVHRE